MPKLRRNFSAGFARRLHKRKTGAAKVQSVKSLEYKGFVRPTTLLVGGTDYFLEVVRSAWGRRMLRPPVGYDIVMLGDLDPVTMNLVAQTQFAPLPEALCKVVYDLTSEGITASMSVISKRLKTSFPEIMVPSDDILYKTLGTLIRERKLYHTGSGYSVVTPDTFRLLAMSPPLERQMLLTNEEAIVRLHGAAYADDDGRAACTQTQQQDMLTAWSSAERILEPRKQGKLKRCHSLKLLRSRDKEKLSRSNSFKSTGTSPGPNGTFSEGKTDVENVDPTKKEKSPSMFSKLFRRGRSSRVKSKTTTSSTTQFPPRDWGDPDYVHFNSRATQTLEKNEGERRIKGRSSSLNRTSSKDRHSQNLSYTPATPRVVHRNSSRHPQSSEVYHYRSSSLSRKPSPSPKREIRQPPVENPSPRIPNGYQNSNFKNTPQEVKPRPRYESSFSPFSSRRKTQSLLMASDKYGNIQNGFNNQQGMDAVRNAAREARDASSSIQNEASSLLNGSFEHPNGTSTLRNGCSNHKGENSVFQNGTSTFQTARNGVQNGNSSFRIGSSAIRKEAVSPYQSTDVTRPSFINSKLPAFAPSPEKKKESLFEWRRPTSFISTFNSPSMLNASEPPKPPPARVIPRLPSMPKESSSIPLSKTIPPTQPASKTIVNDFKRTETLTKTFPNNGKELRLGATVDVEISVANSLTPQKKTLLMTDIDNPVKNDLLKIATTWNHSFRTNNTKAKDDLKDKVTTGIPKLTSTTNITTSVTRGPVKDTHILNKTEELLASAKRQSSPLLQRTTIVNCNSGRDSPGKDTVCSSSPRSTLTADAKSEFFSESPNTTAEVHLSKDDSGFSSSASTSRPMSVSPC
ncbi:storkhead-box protein 2-like [Uloborus diversus]|uniref:storkhead-box protein 2-like n=1 Tax=Uloborus diversus TaxID=327109 RepID=UPI0024098F67|nr:storkhead-box protein 2-like [Uloborus diversus]